MSVYVPKPNASIRATSERSYFQVWTNRKKVAMEPSQLPAACHICQVRDIGHFRILRNGGSPLVVHVKCVGWRSCEAR